MSKQVKNKKGKVAKSALSVALAASMVVSSSAFVYAGPVVEEVSPADVQLEAPAVISEESVGEELQRYTFADSSFTIVGNPFSLSTEELGEKICTAIKGVSLRRNVNGIYRDTYTIGGLLAEGSNYYNVKITNSAGESTDITASTTTVPVAAGSYTVTVSGNNNVINNLVAQGSISGTYTINVADNTTITAEFENENSISYNGSEHKPAITLTTDNGVELTSSDYTVLGYYNNVNACGISDEDGAYALVEFKGNYISKGKVKYHFAIAKADFSKINPSLVKKSVVYNGAKQQPELKVEYTPAGTTTPITLVQDKDFTVELKKDGKEVTEAKDAGEYTISLTAAGDNFDSTYTDTLEYVIEKQNFDSTVLSVEVPDVAYIGNQAHPAVPVVTDKATGTKIKSNQYTIYYMQEDGTYTTVCPATEAEKTYQIKLSAKADSNYKAGDILASYKVVKLGNTLQDYVQKYNPVLTGATNGNQYTYDKDGVVPESVTINSVVYSADGTITGNAGEVHGNFKAVFPDAKDCKGVGTYEIKLVGQGEWAGQTAVIPYKVTAKSMKDEADKLKPVLYKTHSNDLTTSITISDTCHESAYVLNNGVDYTYEIKKTGDKYQVSINFIGNYKGSSTVAATLSEKALDLSTDAIKAEVKGEYIYTGAPKEPSIEDIILTEVNGDKTITLRPGIDYKLADKPYDDNINVGKAKVKVVAISGAYSGEREIEFEITAGETVKDNYVLDTTSLKPVYELGTNFNPAEDIKIKTTTGKLLVKNNDYKIKYLRDGKEIIENEANTKAGSVTMEITINDQCQLVKNSKN